MATMVASSSNGGAGFRREASAVEGAEEAEVGLTNPIITKRPQTLRQIL